MLWLYNRWRQLRDKAFSLAVARSFDRFGRRSVLRPPISIYGAGQIRIGREVMVGPGSVLHAIGGRVTLGDFVRSTGTLYISSAVEVTLGDHVLLGRNVTIVDNDHRHDGVEPIRLQGLGRTAPVRINDGAWLGQNVVVLAGVTIGANAVVAAGAVVTRDVPARATVGGVPARLLGQVPV